MSSTEPQRLPHPRATHPARSPHRARDTTVIPRPATQTQMPPPDNSSSSPRPKAASRLIHSVKRTLTPASATKKPHHSQYSKSAKYSTIAESSSSIPQQRQQFRDPDPSSSRPTIEQIAMGLHLSRTPHLRPLAPSPYAFSQRNSAPHSANPYEAHPHHRTTPITLPPPPTRSSLKKPSATTVTSSSSSPAVSPPFSSASGSTTTVTSMTPSSSHAPRSFAAIKVRMARFLPHSRSGASAPPLMSSPPISPRGSTSDLQPKKAVRFSAEEVRDGD
ncbi:hypothetical protein BJ912DRAFT_1053516 [Pholiota molesta]|nr:hypothetical protein BJ912DRAFT_1053516 [Pholiota molesta]